MLLLSAPASAIKPGPPIAPALDLYKENTYWASYADYVARRLDVDYLVGNNGAITAYDVLILSTETGSGASCQAFLYPPGPTNYPPGPNQWPHGPCHGALGTLVPGSTLGFTLVYDVPEATGSFSAVIHGSAQDDAGATYSYPDCDTCLNPQPLPPAPVG